MKILKKSEIALNISLYRWLDQILFSRQTAIIMYHGFTDKTGQLENYHGKHLHIQTFRKHLQYLKEHYSLISLNQFVDHCQSKIPLPPHSVILTFDDGYESNFILGFPVLQEFDAPATIFLTTDFIEGKQFIWPNRIEYALLATKNPSLRFQLKNEELIFDLSRDEARKDAIDTIKTLLKLIDSRLRNEIVDTIEQTLEQKLMFNEATPDIHRALTWQQIQQMAQSRLITFGAHTCAHENLAMCAPDVAEKEISVSKRIIEDRINTNCPLFCYPYGGQEAFNNQTKEYVQKAGFRSALTTITGTNGPQADLFTLKRLGTSDLVGMDNFKDKLLNSHRALHRLRQKFF